MKYILLLSVVVILLTAGTANAVLTVHENVPGQKITFDTVSNNYWVWDLSLFSIMTYEDQINAIANLAPYGGISSGWHMATRSEMDALWTHSGEEIAAHFKGAGSTATQESYIGRFDQVPSQSSDTHYVTYMYVHVSGFIYKEPLGAVSTPDAARSPTSSAWVCTSSAPGPATVIPAPGAIVLGGMGIGLVGWLRRRRTL